MEQIEKIKGEILAYQQMPFNSEQEDYQYNEMLKNRLRNLIVDFHYDKHVVEEALLTLAITTGCAEDQEIAEKILEYLLEKKLINSDHLDFFYKNVSTARWD